MKFTCEEVFAYVQSGGQSPVEKYLVLTNMEVGVRAVESDDILSLSTPCYIAPRPEFGENEEEIFSEYAIENNMDYYC